MSNFTCPVCGAHPSHGQRFCAECGSRLNPAATPAAPAADERNSVLHRPGGGQPDPFQVGAAETGLGGDDDFFTQFRPKAADAPAVPEGELPTRRSRRRFNPNIYETGPVKTPGAHTTGQVPPLFPGRVDAATEQPQQPPAASAPGHPAPATSPFDAAGEPVQPATSEMSVGEIQQALCRQPQPVDREAERAQRAEEQARAAATWGVDPERRRVADEATFTQLIEGLPNDPADRPIESPEYVRANTEQVNVVRPPAESDRSEPARPEPSQPEPAQAQWLAPEPARGAEAGHPAEAEAPIESPFAPLPQPQVDPEQVAQQEHANALFGRTAGSEDAPGAVGDDEPTNRVARNSLPPLPPLASEPAASEPTTSAPAASQPGPSQPGPGHQVASEPDHDDLDWIDRQFDGGSHAERMARNEREVPASQRDWRASDRRTTERNAQVGVGDRAAFASDRTVDGVQPTDRRTTAPAPQVATPPASGGAPPRFTPEEVRRRRRGVAAILLAAAAALLIVVGSFVVKGLFGGGDDAPDVADEQPKSTEQPANPEPTGQDFTPQPQEPTTDPFEPQRFQSESGNIRCQITTEDGVVCQILSPNFTVPPEVCQSGFFPGAAVGVSKDGVTYPCLTGTLTGGTIVAYDVPIHAEHYSCVINYETGVSCDNGMGDSFTLEYTAGIQTNGKTAPTPQPEIEPVV